MLVITVIISSTRDIGNEQGTEIVAIIVIIVVTVLYSFITV